MFCTFVIVTAANIFICEIFHFFGFQIFYTSIGNWSLLFSYCIFSSLNVVASGRYFIHVTVMRNVMSGNFVVCGESCSCVVKCDVSHFLLWSVITLTLWIKDRTKPTNMADICRDWLTGQHGMISPGANSSGIVCVLVYFLYCVIFCYFCSTDISVNSLHTDVCDLPTQHPDQRWYGTIHQCWWVDMLHVYWPRKQKQQTRFTTSFPSSPVLVHRESAGSHTMRITFVIYTEPVCCSVALA